MSLAGDAARHLAAHAGALSQLRREADHLTRWGEALAAVLHRGGRLLAAGNGGSAAEAQHLTAELVGRFACERGPFSAVALHADTSSLTAMANDYGWDRAYARAVEAHGRDGDVLLAMSTSGASGNLLSAAHAARRRGITTWALTGPAPNPLARACRDAICIAAPPAVVQEAHLIAVHVLCAVVDAASVRQAGDGADVIPIAGAAR